VQNALGSAEEVRAIYDVAAAMETIPEPPRSL